RTQQVIAYETGIPAVPDPFGGSEYIEKFTDQIETGAREYIARIDALGGAVAAIERGYIQKEIQNSAYEYQKAVEEGRQIVVGINRFQSEEVSVPRPFRIHPELERSQIARLRELRASRSQTAVSSATAQLEAAARGTENLIPRILKCCQVFATVGEISDTLKNVFGEYRESF
ncbi:MAG: methylmalonyl-CoA mutase family protein, partial [Bryobacteraceae bacterium]